MEFSSVSPVGEWDLCGDRFYSKTQLYSLQWQNVKLEEMRVACGGYGGPIAVIRDERKMVVVQKGEVRPVMKIFTSAGRLLGSFVWDRGRIAALGWSESQELLIVDIKGEVSIYSLHGERSAKGFSLGSECSKDEIFSCTVFPTGLVAMTNTFALWAITNLADPRPQRLFYPGITSAPLCMCVIEPRHTLSGGVEVVLSVDGTLLVVDSDAVHDQKVDATLMALSVAPNGQFLAGFTADGRVMVWVVDFTKVLSDFKTEMLDPPDQLAWCGTDSVVMTWKDTLMMIGPYGDCVRYSIACPSVLVLEVDGVRILANEGHDFLRRIPDDLTDVFRVGSTSPGALLYDARKLFDSHNAKSDEVLRSIVSELPEAVASCCDAAGQALDPVFQTKLMMAACYGRAFCPTGSFPKLHLVNTARKLRIVNALKDPSVGMPLTLTQLDSLSLPQLIQRLNESKHHLLAFRISQIMGLATDKVVQHWACAKISAAQDTPDDELMELLVRKLKISPSVSYAALATHADSCGRKGLAALLLENERCAADQVPLLLSLGEYDRALAKACDSGDPDLVYFTLFHLYRHMDISDFLHAISFRSYARNLFLAYCKRQDPELLEQLYITMGMYEGAAQMKLMDAIEKGVSGGERTARGGRSSELAVMEFVRRVDKAAELYGQTKEHTFYSKACSDLSRLRKLQAELEEETGQAAFLGLSVINTIKQCIRLGNMRAAQKVKSEFKVSDRHYGWLKVRTLVAAKDWEGLDLMTKDKKLPVQLLDIIATAKAAGAPQTTLGRLISRLQDAKKKAEEYAAIGMYQEAAETAAQVRDSDMLSKIQGMVGTHTALGLAVGQIKERLQERR